MPNMSYCRFHNTLADLIDCQESFNKIESRAELRCALELIEVCKAIVAEVDPADLKVREDDED